MIVIYGLRCPLANTIRYIGKTKEPARRLKAHIRGRGGMRTQHQHCARWIRALLKRGLEPSMEILHEVAPDESWEVAEAKYIAAYRAAGYHLTNLTSGGQGLQDAPAVRERIRESLKIFYSDPKQRARLARSRAEGWNADSQRRHREARKAWLASAEGRAFLMRNGRELANRPGARAAFSAAGKAAWSQLTPDQFSAACAKRSETLRAAFADPAVKARRLAAMQSPEAKAKALAKRAANKGATSAKLRAAWVRRRANKLQEGR